ncbi:MAG: phosphotransferase family protein [Pseudomonadota bacterium]
MSAAAPLDLDAIAAWLGERVEGFGGPMQVRQFAGGQSNPTFLLTTPGGRFVLRRKPPGELLKSAHAVDREFAVQEALAGSDVPVAPMRILCEDESVIGTAFYVMDHVPGRNFDDPRLPGLTSDERAAIYDEMGRVLAAIHTVDVDRAGLSDYGRAGDYFARQIGRWTRQYRASASAPSRDMDRLIAWLEAHQPPDDGRRTLVHGDFRIDNLLFAEEGPQCVAVLDWELSTLGHPLADLAALLMQWRLPPGEQGRGLGGVDRTALGLPSDEAFVASYFARTRTPPQDLSFPIAFCFFRMAAILEGVKARGLQGNAANPARAAQLGAMVPLYIQGGLKAADGNDGQTVTDGP